MAEIPIPKEALRQAEEIYQKLEPRYNVVGYKGDKVVRTLFENQTQQDAAQITYLYNMGRTEKERAQGVHIEMEKQTSTGDRGWGP